LLIIPNSMWLHTTIKLLNLNEVLPALALGLNMCCAWFLSHSFLTIGLPILRELGAGALWEKPLKLFGVRWKIVETAITQKAEVIYGLWLLVLAAFCGIITLFMSLKPNSWIFSFIIVIITIILFVGLGRIIVPLLKYCFFTKAAKNSLQDYPGAWLELERNQRNEKIAEEVGCYNLGKFYGKLTVSVLQKYLEKLNNTQNDKSDKHHNNRYGQLWKKKPRK